MKLSRVETLERFQLGGLLGEGADLQVFKATDSATGECVVVKRPHPTLVSRNIHRDVENRILLQAKLRSVIGDMSSLVHLHLLTEPDSVDWYFGDCLSHHYSVQIEERARGIPLVGGVSDMVRGYPVALPLNLFVLHPAKGYMSSGHEHPSLTVLAIIERLYEEGYLVQDLGPQNVFYSPGSGVSRVIDLGTLRQPKVATPRHSSFDLNDILFDLFRQYTTPELPPRESSGFAQAWEARLSGTTERKSEALSRDYMRASDGRSEAALEILSKIGRREYMTTQQFRKDFQGYLTAAALVEIDEVTAEAWLKAAQGLRTSYWKKYLFDAESEMD